MTESLKGWNTKQQCPWCKKLIVDLWETLGHDESVEFDCPHCEKPIKLTEWRQYVMERVE